MTTFKFTDRESYFKWLANWKSEYVTLSKEIRNLKKQRKPYFWAYPEGADRRTSKKLITGRNPVYSGNAHWQVQAMKSSATALMIQRDEARAYSKQLRAARLAKEAVPA